MTHKKQKIKWIDGVISFCMIAPKHKMGRRITETERKELLKYGYDFSPNSTYTFAEVTEAREKVEKVKNNIIILKPLT